MISIANYKKVESLEEAWTLNQKRSNKIVGGMLWLKMGKGRVQTAIDMSGLGLDKIEETETEFRIGCMATLRLLETHEGFNKYTCGAIKDALCHIVGVQFRNIATVGGSIFGRYGFSDVLTMFMAMESYVELYKGGIVPMSEFSAMKYDNDILVNIIVKKTPAKFSYMSVRNSKTDFPVITCAAAVYDDKPAVFAIGARPAKAVIVRDDENILNKNCNETDCNRMGKYVSERVATGTNMRASASYRKHLVGVLVKRSSLKLLGEESER